MRAYQLLTSSTSTGCCSLIGPCRCSICEHWTGGRCYAVPSLPGRAMDFTPYPFGRRRRRR
ncbi:MAG TPA: hypothetical protein VN954_11570 [Ktedonobacteraceae bacterium]|nr:hypothetical protein [Ktedonobacteraceae bacterium]